MAFGIRISNLGLAHFRPNGAHQLVVYVLLTRGTFSLVQWKLGPEQFRDQLSGDVVSVDGIALASNTTVKHLGVIFDQDFYFNSHVRQISRTAFLVIYVIFFLNQADLVSKRCKKTSSCVRYF